MAGSPIPYDQWTWEQMVQYVLGDGTDTSGGTPMDRLTVAGAGVEWIRFVETTTVKTATGVPPVITPGPNELIGFRRTGTATQDNSLLENATAPTTQQDVWQVVKAKVTFFDGSPSPSAAFTTFYTGATNTLTKLFSDGNRIFDPLSFHDAGVTVRKAEDFLLDAEAKFRSLLGQIGDSGSGLEGTAAAVFVEALERLRLDTSTLAADMKAASPGNRWSDRIYFSSNDLWDFRNKINLAWREFSDHTFQWFNTFNPTTLINTVRSVLEQFGNGTLSAVTVDIPNTYGTGTYGGTYDLTAGADWTRLNNELKRSWNEQVQRLDGQIRDLLTALATKFDGTGVGIETFTRPATNHGSNGNAHGSNDERTGGGGTDTITGIGGADIGGGATAPIGRGPFGVSTGYDAGSKVGALSVGARTSWTPDGTFGGSTISGLGGAVIGGLGPPSVAGGWAGPGSGGLSGLGRAFGGSGAYGNGKPDSRAAATVSVVGIEGGGAGIEALGGPVGPANHGGVAVGDDLAELLNGYAAVTGAGSAHSGTAQLRAVGAGAASEPFPPLLGGLGGLGGRAGAGEKERSRPSWLAEEAAAWGADPDCMAAVVGRADAPKTTSGDRPVEDMPTPGRVPKAAPAQGRTRASGHR